GMGVVYKAEDTALQRTVALKFLPPKLTRDADAKQRFLHEARAAARLDHPNICTVYEVGESDGQLFLAMACYEGMTLREKLQEGPLPWAEAATLAMQAAAGLSEAHAHGIVHRDIKPANLFLTAKGQLKLLDFGLAKLAGASVLTQTGTTVGTAHYMSPEQARGEAVDARSDVWSLGAVLYEMVSGRPPFRGEYAQAVIYGILNEAPPPLADFAPNMPAALSGVVAKCLAKDPSARPAAAWELADALAGCLGLEAPTAPVSYKEPRTARPGWRRWPAAAAALVVLLAVAGIVAWRSGWFPFDTSPRMIRLAVLPLANLSGDPEQEYLSDGLTQELINQLGRLHPAGLSVIARTSVMRYKKTETPIDQIGRELNVDYVLEGSAQREGARIRVTAELIRVEDQAQLWGNAFERELAGVLALQSDVAKKVAGALALHLLPAERARLANVRTVNPEAHDAYLKGSYHWKKLTKNDIDTAQQYFDLALAKDPDYAPAYEGLAWVWAARQQMHILLPREAGPKAKAAALRAVALDDTSSGAHEALAIVKSWIDWDWVGAAPVWRRALELDSNSANIHAYYAHYLAHTGHSKEALTHSLRSIELDPFNALYHALYSTALMYSRRHDDALAEARTAVALQADNPPAITALYRSLYAKGEYGELTEIQRKRSRNPEALAAFERGFAIGGFKEGRRNLADFWSARYGTPEGLSSALGIAYMYLDAGEIDRVFVYLEKAFEERDSNLPYLSMPFYKDRLHTDPRYQALLWKMNLPLDGNR
ncbi:MAG TPA: protein kinase, partial [Acidobacteriota bacterium]|nr:protein kinase [Acidobacteriota bacterium]